jgi:hypothetical protein
MAQIYFKCFIKCFSYTPLCSNDKLIIITSRTEVKGLPAEYKGFKIKIMDVHDKSTEKSESETLSAFDFVFSSERKWSVDTRTNQGQIRMTIKQLFSSRVWNIHFYMIRICTVLW